MSSSLFHHDPSGSLHEGGSIGSANNRANREQRQHELWSYLMSVDGSDQAIDEQDLLFIQLAVDTVFASYAAAKNRVCQYTQLLRLPTREEALWAERVEKAKCVMPEYQSRFSFDLQQP
ncbi:uncharacterized protein F5891DRAFT_1280005 [Suillus fuscotomentosus]|uniref:Uncharacterized protein n=1 Tax=Suillus fuscotomentosus TaxID=1912939 RepID=A0AAD4E0M3_9AGAM|nr:uncharacterized protein F5891DRAFT_1280005 [Suillus fuscotomentosus]KAG1897563.1 hypothetical protein F5891DRAFT_1280005 [Suillus fuscotomentosus]